MRFISSFISLLIIAAKRVWHHRLLMLCLLAGLIVAVGLLSSIPLYADAIHNRLLQGELTDAGTYRPPFSFLWRYVGAWNGEITWDEYAPVDEYLVKQSAAIVGLPSDDQIRHVSTSNLRLFSGQEGVFSDDAPLIWASLGFISDLEQQIHMVEGNFPSGSEAGDAVEVIISQKTADLLGLQVGESYILFGAGSDSVKLPLRISGVWRPADPNNPFWFYKPESFDGILLTAEEAFFNQVVPALETPVATAVWYQIFDGSKVRPATVNRLLGGVATIEARVTALLNNTTLDVSPVSALQDYGESSSDLAVVLTVFSLPLIGLVLYFIILIAGMVVRREQSEIAIMRSRGTTRGQILLIYLMEGLLVGMLGLVGGLLLGSWLARLMGQTKTFLDPAMLARNTDPLVTVISSNALLYAVLAVVLVLLALLWPALLASRHTIVTLRWQQARTLIRPLWQRYYLDLLLLVPPLYGLYQLNRQGAIALLGATDDPFSNPMLFLVPILFCFALGLFVMRLFPLVMRALARLAEVLPGTALMMTFRQLARSASLYTGPLLLLCFTVSLAVFTASMALTLDNHLRDRVYYQFGADLNLAELGENTEETQQSSSIPGQEQPPSASTEVGEDEPRWLFLPVGEHLLVPGVKAATRVGDYSATANIGGRQQAGRLLGLDRIDFAKVGFFRPDFAQNESLGGVLNRLAIDRTNVLLSRNFMARNGLIPGDPLRLNVGAAGDFSDVDFTVAGPLELFPTVYPQDGPFFVANLDYIHEALGGAYPYNVWLATDPGVDGEEIVEGVREIGLSVVSVNNTRETIVAERDRPERQGLFGLLSAGFLAAAALTVLGFLVYAIVSFQRRFIELGMLRAIGLSMSQMGFYLACEQAVIILTGVGLGTALGVLASYLFIPYFQVGSTKADLVPPFIVKIAWPELVTIYAIFAIMFVIAVAVLIGLLIRMRVFEAIKMGEAV